MIPTAVAKQTGAWLRRWLRREPLGRSLRVNAGFGVEVRIHYTARPLPGRNQPGGPIDS